MLIRGELVLVLVGVAVAIIAIASVLSQRLALWRTPLAVVGCAMAGLAPLLSYPFIDPARAQGEALWEWSAVGGPTVQASYRLDALATSGLAIGVLYAGASLVATTRVHARSSLLRPALLVNTLFLITLVVTDDLVAAIVVLGALATSTTFVALLVAPAPAVARVTAYLAAGIQAFVASSLLITRFGAGSFRFDAIPPDSMTPGVVLAATAGAALFAGLYPFVPWGFRQDESGERESLRGLLTMPAGVAATILLVRVVGATDIESSHLSLPGAIPSFVIALAAVALAASLWRWRRGRPRARRRVVVSAAVLGLVLLYPYLHWSHLVMIACLLAVAYAAAVSLAQPEQWTVTRYDVTLAAAWIGLAAGTPAALAGAIAVLVGGALAALADAFWMPPHRAYIAMLASTTSIVASCLLIAVGVIAAPDAATIVLGLLAIAAVIALELVHVGRRLNVAKAPPDLELAGTLFAFLATALVATLVAVPAVHAAAAVLGRIPDERIDTAAYGVAAIVMIATALTVVAGAVRPLLPDMAPVAARLTRLVAIADPVPTAAGAFRALERSATAASTGFTLFEQRAGVWLALVLIAGVLAWSVR